MNLVLQHQIKNLCQGLKQIVQPNQHSNELQKILLNKVLSKFVALQILLELFFF